MSAPTSRSPSVHTDASTAQFTLPAKGFALSGLFTRVPDARVECESALATPDDHALLIIRSDECEHDINAALQSAPSVAAVERFGERADGWIYRVAWEGRPQRLIQRLVAAGVTIQSVRGRGGQWKLRLLTPTRKEVSQAHDIINDIACGSECRSITSVGGWLEDSATLTDEQHEALVTAFEAGHYDIPRNVTAAEVATELGISHQALSERFRRAYRHLIKSEFVVNEERC